MIYYRGFDIPDTVQEFTRNIESSMMMSGYPSLILNQRNSNAIIKATFTPENLVIYKDDLKVLIEKCKCLIDLYLDQGGK